MIQRILAGASALALPALTFGAGGHYAVNDAAIVDAGQCLVEAWYARAGRHDDEVAVLPSCNPQGNLELALGISRLRVDGDADTILDLGFKTLVREAEPGRIGWGLAGSSTWGGAFERHEGATLYVPVSLYASDVVLVHVNAGWSFERDARDVAVWGVGADYAATGSLHLIGEVYGTHRGGTELQGGIRFQSGTAVVDFSYGRARGGAAESWVTLGLGWGF